MVSLPLPRTPDPADAPPLRWGILAPGGIAGSFVQALSRHTRQEVVACGSRSLERARSFAREHGVARAYGSYEQLVADPAVDAVYVASPHHRHAEQALLAIAAGKHVLVEKAFTRNAAEARAVVAAAQASGLTVMEAMWTRFLPHVDVIRRVLSDGLLGEVETLVADHGQWFAPDPRHRLYDPDAAGGALLDLGVYPVSFASFVLGAPGRVTAVGTKAFTGVDRQVSAVLDRYQESAATALVTTTLAAATPVTASVSGSQARLEVPGPFYVPQAVRLVTRSGESVESGAPTIRGHEGLCFEAAHFATLVAEQRPESPLLPLDETLAIMETLDDVRAQVGVVYPGEAG